MTDNRTRTTDEEDVNDLLYRVLEYRNSAKFRKLLNFCVHFRRLSPFNAMLLAVQRPGCEFALTAHRWERDYGRVPKTDARPLIIIRPFGPVEYLFDVADTVAVDPTHDRVPEELSGAFKYRQLVDPELFQQLKCNLPLWGVKYEDMVTGGRYDGKLQVATEKDGKVAFYKKQGMRVNLPVTWRAAYTIKTKNGMDETAKFGTILHELGHLFCHHLPSGYAHKWSEKLDRLALPKNQEEFEAETIAWLVGHRVGLEIPSSYEYLSGYLDDGPNGKEIPKFDFYTVFQAASEVEKLLRPCGFKDGWLWEYSPALQKEYHRLNPPVRAVQAQFEF